MSGFKILYEDDHIIVADKPAGMLVIPTPKGESNTLTSLLNRELDARGIEANAHPCHRIDRDTSGLIIYAKGKKAQQAMMEEFRARRVKKSYIAFVHGRLVRKAGAIDLPIEGKKSVTKYKVLEERRDFSVVEIEPETGRTNQIRIHFKSIGHPLVGERKFAFAKDYKLKFRRAALHSHKIGFEDPFTKKPLGFTTPLPEDMAKFLEATPIVYAG
ncbi:MAG: RluA family pseudouridine synthase [Candidatus Omnitrophota bacterium]|jgi:RluA family pseudouridine synthase